MQNYTYSFYQRIFRLWGYLGIQILFSCIVLEEFEFKKILCTGQGTLSLKKKFSVLETLTLKIKFSGDFDFYEEISCTGDFEFDGKIPCTGDFDFDGKILCTGDF